MDQNKLSFYGQPRSKLKHLFAKEGLSLSGVDLLYNWHYKKNRRDKCEKDLAKIGQQFIAKTFDFYLPKIDFIQESSDKTVKFLFALLDGQKVETVLIPFKGKYTICLSSQVGCAMKCSFCFTGTQGLKRNLKAEEIVGQFLSAKNWLSSHRPDDDRILNIVFMGQGEPLHNFDAVRTSCEIFLDRNGLSLAPHKITISTAGYLPGLLRWKEEMPKVNIAVSFHSPIKKKRDKLIPLNQKYPIEDIVAVAEQIPEGRTRFVTYEYLLIKNFNDSGEDAHATGKFLADKNAYISLIPFNPFPGTEYKRPSNAEVEAFKRILDQYRIPILIRKTKGDEILAACGQLNSALTHLRK